MVSTKYPNGERSPNNVLQGSIRLVGSRPLLPEYLPRYSDFQRRHLA